jgi:hypothetical protein
MLVDRLNGALKGAFMGAVQGWNGTRPPDTTQSLNQNYWFLYDLYTGRMFDAAWRREGVFRDERVYRNVRLLYNPIQSIVDYYAATVYQGQLSTDGRALPDGSRGAIPIDPQTGEKETGDQLFAAVAELWNRWKWQRGMRLPPRYAAILGEILIEVVDDPEHHAAWPQIVWPGFVKDITLDIVGDVKAYTLEYKISRVENGQQVTFDYRKEVDQQEFRFFREDKPWTDTSENGHGDAVQENPYGFVPAVWIRHRTVFGDRGLSAIAGVRQALLEYNSFFSHAIDYQRKPFSAQVLLKGSNAGSSQVNKAKELLFPSRSEDPSSLAQSLNVRRVGPDAGYEYLEADIGQTVELLKAIKDGILEANPEASFFHELRGMSQLTGPAAERALGDASSRTNEARAEHDPQTIKLHQMAIAICGYRLNETKDWESPTKRDEVFRPFRLDSFKAGLLDMTILGRDVVPATEEERLALVQGKESLKYAESLIELGYEEKVAKAMIDGRVDVQQARAVLYDQAAQLPEPLIKKLGIFTPDELAAVVAAQEEGRAIARRAFARGDVNPAFEDEDEEGAVT